MSAVSSASDPTPPRLHLRIGVSGHRVPPKLPKESEAPLRALLDHMLAAMVDTLRKAEKHHDSRAPMPDRKTAAGELIVVSSLAEGADRIVAEAGLAAGFELHVALPLSRGEYALDFDTEASRAAFERLLGRAAAVIDLNGAPNQRPRAYEAAGLFMLANIDVLIAIWDGQVAAGVGGTAEIVGRAIADGIFVVWIEPLRPDAPRISRPNARPPRAAAVDQRLTDNFRSADVATIARVVGEILTSPKRLLN
jgi:hypothetical protein